MERLGLERLENDHGKVEGNRFEECDFAESHLASQEAEPFLEGEHSVVMEMLTLKSPANDRALLRARLSEARDIDEILDAAIKWRDDSIRSRFSDLVGKLVAWKNEHLRTEVDSQVFAEMRHVISEIIFHDNVKLFAGALMFAYELNGTNGFPNQSRFAQAISVTRSAVSKAVCSLRDNLTIRKNCHMKSDEARKKFSDVQKTNHFRRRVFDFDQLEFKAAA